VPKTLRNHLSAIKLIQQIVPDAGYEPKPQRVWLLDGVTWPEYQSMMRMAWSLLAHAILLTAESRATLNVPVIDCI
jgi:hypothetical protein